MRLLAAALLLSSVATGCEDDGATLVVDLRTDFALGEELASLEITSLEGPDNVFEASSDLEGDALGGLRVAEVDGLTPGLYHIRMVGRRPGGAYLSETEFLIQVEGTVIARALLTRDCAGVRCPDGDPELTACLGGRCEHPRCAAGESEACVAPRECDTAGDCGAPPTCGEWVCSDRGVCLVGTTPATCADSEWCNPEAGCLPKGSDAPSDAGAPDGGADDGGADLPDTCSVDEDCTDACGMGTCVDGACVRSDEPDCTPCDAGFCVAGRCVEGAAALHHDFEDGLPGWSTEGAPWQVDEAAFFRGRRSVTSGFATADQPSSLIYQLDLARESRLTFWYRVAEKFRLTLLVDGTPVLNHAAYLREDWQRGSVVVEAGRHRLEWRAEHVSFGAGSSAVHLDEVSILATPSAVEDFEGPFPPEGWTNENWEARDDSGDRVAAPTVDGAVLSADITLEEEGSLVYDRYIPRESRLELTIDGTVFRSMTGGRQAYPLSAGDHEIAWTGFGDTWIDDVSMGPPAGPVCE